MICLDAPHVPGPSPDPSEACEGAVEYRMSMSPTGVSYPRCAAHYDRRLKVQSRLSREYGVPMTYTGFEPDSDDDPAGDEVG